MEDKREKAKPRRHFVVSAIVVVVLAAILFVPLPLTATSSGACAEGGTSECRDGGTVNVASPTNLYELLVNSIFQQ